MFLLTEAQPCLCYCLCYLILPLSYTSANIHWEPTSGRPCSQHWDAEVTRTVTVPALMGLVCSLVWTGHKQINVSDLK